MDKKSNVPFFNKCNIVSVGEDIVLFFLDIVL